MRLGWLRFNCHKWTLNAPVAEKEVSFGSSYTYLFLEWGSVETVDSMEMDA